MLTSNNSNNSNNHQPPIGPRGPRLNLREVNLWAESATWLAPIGPMDCQLCILIYIYIHHGQFSQSSRDFKWSKVPSPGFARPPWRVCPTTGYKCIKITRDKKNLKLGKVNPLTLNYKSNSKWNPCSTCSTEKIMVSELRAPWPQWCKIQIATSCARAAYQTSFQTCIDMWLDTSWHILTLWILSNMALWVVVLLWGLEFYILSCLSYSNHTVGTCIFFFQTHRKPRTQVVELIHWCEGCSDGLRIRQKWSSFGRFDNLIKGLVQRKHPRNSGNRSMNQANGLRSSQVKRMPALSPMLSQPNIWYHPWHGIWRCVLSIETMRRSKVWLTSALFGWNLSAKVNYTLEYLQPKKCWHTNSSNWNATPKKLSVSLLVRVLGTMDALNINIFYGCRVLCWATFSPTDCGAVETEGGSLEVIRWPQWFWYRRGPSETIGEHWRPTSMELQGSLLWGLGMLSLLDFLLS